MIELSVIRDIVAIAGVFIGLTYYIMNIREVRHNRKITLTTTMLQHFMTGEGYRNIMELTGMQWDSLDDFMQKYDHRVNRENAAKRIALWNTCNTIGGLYRDGMLDLKTVYNSSGGIICNIWYKFKPIIEYYRITDYDDIAYKDFEYLASELEKKYRGGLRN
jgi:hypothetical protein